MISPLKILSFCLLIAMTAVGFAEEKTVKPPADKAKSEEWIQLFNGKDLQGWTPKIKSHPIGENFGNTFRVENGVLKVVYDKEKYVKFKGQFGHLFYKEKFSNYILRVEYRFVGEQATAGPGWAIRNSGVMIHGEAPETMELNQDFPASIEVQLLGGNGKDPRSTLNVCTPGTNIVMSNKLITQHCNNSKSKTYAGEDWVTVEIEVHGSKVIRHKIDGQLVLEYTEPQLDPSDAHAKELIAKRDGKLLLDSGTISLQSESHPVEFRKVELLKLQD